MKLKSLAALGMASLLAASIAYVSPVLAADDVTANIGSDDSTPAAMDNGTQADTTTAPSNDTTVTPNNDTSSSSTSDQGTPDTATGDDDY